MLDGLLGRGAFYSKCKPLVKQTRTRIDMIRRKRNATQKFLKEDIADLLANGRESHAYARAEGLIKELILSSCYDFIDHICEMILKHLSVMQKLRECPEDCREAVASLMFAAARFSDLPELRDLRDTFQERYGNSLECNVNQKFVQNTAPKSPSMDKRLELMQDIASEFSIMWDPKGFEQRMPVSSTAGEDKAKNNVPVFEKEYVAPVVEKKYVASIVEETAQKSTKDAVIARQKNEVAYHSNGRQVPYDRHQVDARRGDTVQKRDEANDKIANGQEYVTSRSKPPFYPPENSRKVEDIDTTNQLRKECLLNGHGSAKQVVAVPGPGVLNGENASGKRLEHGLSKGKLREASPARTDIHDLSADKSSYRLDTVPTVPKVRGEEGDSSKGVRNAIPVPKVPGEERDSSKSARSAIPMHKLPGEERDPSKSVRSAIPPPYVKPMKSKHKESSRSKHSELDTLSRNAASDGDKSEKLQVRPSGSESEDGLGRFTEEYYKDTEPTPRRRSSRRKHSRSSSVENINGDVKEGRVVRRISSNRRRGESRKGLQILFDDDHFKKKDEEEKLIDNLLMHYSKKPTKSDPGKLRRKSNAESPDARQSSRNKDARDGSRAKLGDLPPVPSRSISMPRENSSSEHTKVFARAASFQQEPVKHVHPKLPDYDDLAARFAALRKNMG